MGPPHHLCPAREDQGRCPSRPRARLCLLKGCERWFVPHHPRCRYCSSVCRQAARRWSMWLANQAYRATAAGKPCRRQQSGRYRQRVRARRSSCSREGGEGYHKAAHRKNSCCHRPGCYERFDRTSRSPQQAYCSSACREAFRRVRVREARWRLSEPDCPFFTPRFGLGTRPCVRGIGGCRQRD